VQTVIIPIADNVIGIFITERNAYCFSFLLGNVINNLSYILKECYSAFVKTHYKFNVHPTL
jgi:hypothetical protein